MPSSFGSSPSVSAELARVRAVLGAVTQRAGNLAVTLRGRSRRVSIRTQQTSRVRRLRQRFVGSPLDPVERAVSEVVINAPDQGSVGSDTQWPVALADLEAKLKPRFTAAEILGAVERLAERGWLLHPGDEVYLTSAGLISAHERGPLRRMRWPRSHEWELNSPSELAQARKALATARQELRRLQALSPPDRSRASIDRAIQLVDRIDDSLR